MADLSILYTMSCFGVFILELIINISKRGSVLLYPSVPAACGITALLFFKLFLKKERKGIHVLVLSVLFILAETAAEWKLCSISGFGAWGITLCLNVLILYTAFGMVTAQKRNTGLTDYFDWSLILLFFVLMMERSGSLKVISSAHFIICALLCGVSLIRSRVISQNTAGNTSGGTLRVTAVSALLMAGAAGLAVFTAKPFGALLISVLVFLRNTALRLLGLVESFLLWLSQFMTPEKAEMDFSEGPASIAGPVGPEQALPSNEYLFIALAAAFIIALTVVAVLTLKSMRFGRLKAVSAVKGRNTGRPGLLSLLIKTFKQICGAVKYRVYLFLRRNTVIGVFLNLERSLKRTPLERRTGQTPQSFLSVCAAAADSMQDEQAAALLRELSAKINGCLYGSTPGNLSFAGARELRIWSSKRKPRPARKSPAKQ